MTDDNSDSTTVRTDVAELYAANVDLSTAVNHADGSGLFTLTPDGLAKLRAYRAANPQT